MELLFQKYHQAHSLYFARSILGNSDCIGSVGGDIPPACQCNIPNLT